MENDEQEVKEKEKPVNIVLKIQNIKHGQKLEVKKEEVKDG